MKRCLAFAMGLMVLNVGLVGCTQVIWGLAEPSGWKYVHRQGGPEQIGNWALRQRDLLRVKHAQLALMRYLTCDVSSEERHAAIEAYRRMDEKLAQGWNDQYPANDPEIIRSRLGIRNILQSACQDGIEDACDAKLQLEALEITT